MKLYSQLEVASLENLGSDPALLPLGRFYYRTDTDKMRIKLSAGVDYVVTEAKAATLTNKTYTVTDNLFTLQDNGGSTSQGQFDCSAVTAGQTRIWTMPDATTSILGMNIATTKGDMLVATASNVVVAQAVGSNDQILTADSAQTNGIAYNTLTDGDLIQNLGIACSVASNALTIALKTAAGNNASSTDPIKVAFRSATLATGTATLVKVTAALSTVISSGSTAGHVSGAISPLYVYLINNAGTAELAWSTAYFDETGLVSTTAEGGAGAADSRTVMYSTTARASVAFRCVAKLVSTQTTAGTWAAVPTDIQIGENARAPYVPLSMVAATSSVKTSTASGNYCAMTGNSLALTPGTWELSGTVELGNNGSTPAYAYGAASYAGANGADSAVAPTQLSAVTNLSVISAAKASFHAEITNALAACIGYTLTMPTVIVTVTANVTVYMVPYSQHTTSANTRITTYFNARKLY